MSCECHNSDAEHEVALANVNFLKAARGLISEIFALPGVQDAVYDVEAAEMFDEIEAWMNQEQT